jgi:hypothetical protein
MESVLQKQKCKPTTGLTLLCKRYAGLLMIMCKRISGQDIIKVWFSASTFVVKIATFAKPKNVPAANSTFAIGAVSCSSVSFVEAVST